MKTVSDNKNVGIWAFCAFAVVCFFGSVLHFLYDWTSSKAVAPFSAVNESTWEHMKIFFFPTFLFALVQYPFFGKHTNGYWCTKIKSTLIGLLLIPVIFYTLQGAFGTTPDWVNISIFFLSAFVAYFWEYKTFKKQIDCKWSTLAFVLFVSLAILFAILTFFPIEIPLFQDPTNGSFGI